MVSTKQERINTAFEYLKSQGVVHKQADIADQLGIARGNISRAMNGDNKYLTNKFLVRFNAAFQNIFSEDWLLTGKGEMLTPSINQTISGDGNTAVAGNGNNVSTTHQLDKALDEIAAQRKVTEKAQEQIDHLIAIIENHLK